MKYPNTIEARVWGRYALFSDPITRVGGEKYTYPVPADISGIERHHGKLLLEAHVYLGDRCCTYYACG